MSKCTFVTYSDLPDLDPDDAGVLEILKQKGFDCRVAVWDDPAIDWADSDVTVLRSTWDYHKKFSQFMNWVEKTSRVSELFNKPIYIRWNAHKTYMRDLAEAGIATIPTSWLTHGEDVDVESFLRNAMEKSGNKLVIKPAIGLATSGVIVVDENNFDEGVSHTKDLLKTVDVMVQPFVASVSEHGEKALVFINGRYCHAAQKTAFQALAVAGGAGEKPVEATVDEVALAEETMSAVAEILGKKEESDLCVTPPLFARVDVVRDASNKPMIIELELVEPSLFMGFYPESSEFFANAIAHALSRAEKLKR